MEVYGSGGFGDQCGDFGTFQKQNKSHLSPQTAANHGTSSSFFDQNEGVKAWEDREKRALTLLQLLPPPCRVWDHLPKLLLCSSSTQPSAWDHGKLQKKKKAKSLHPFSPPRVPDTPAECHKFRRLLAVLRKPESKFLVAEPNPGEETLRFCITGNDLCFWFCFVSGPWCYWMRS